MNDNKDNDVDKNDGLIKIVEIDGDLYYEQSNIKRNKFHSNELCNNKHHIHNNQLLYDIKSEEGLKKSRIRRKLYHFLKKSIIEYDIHHKVLYIKDEKSYDIFVNLIIDLKKQYDNSRIVVADSSGYVIVDTYSQNNSYENYLHNKIHENIHTRRAVFRTQLEKDGTGYENKFSHTTQRFEIYVAIRLGRFRKSSGSIRISIPK